MWRLVIALALMYKSIETVQMLPFDELHSQLLPRTLLLCCCYCKSCDVMSEHEGDDLSHVSVHSVTSAASTTRSGSEGDPLKLDMINRDPNNINDHVEVRIV